MIRMVVFGVLLGVLAVLPAYPSIFDANIIKKVTEVKEQNNQTQVELQAIKNATINTSAKVDATASVVAQIGAKLDANATAIAGVGNKVQQSNSEISEKIGGDKIVTNDTEMVNKLIQAYVDQIRVLNETYRAIIIYLIMQIFILLTLYAKNSAVLNKYFMDYIREDEAREDKINGNKKL